MRRAAALLCILLVNSLSALSSHALILDFESLIAPPTSVGPVPDGYGGVDWTDALVADSQELAFAGTGVVSGGTGRYVMINAFSGTSSLPIGIAASPTAFNFQSANVTAACLDGLAVRFEGFQSGDLPGAPTYDQTIFVNPTGPTPYVPEMLDLVTLVITPSGGSGGVSCPFPALQQVVLDDVAIDEPPISCGNAALDPGEECDAGVGCTLACVCDPLHEPTVPVSTDCSPICGNGRWDPGDPGEECDGGLGCDATCSCQPGFGPTSPASEDCESLCGNSAVDPSEECDGGAACAVDCSCDPGFGSTVPRSLACIELPGWVDAMRNLNTHFHGTEGATDYYVGKVGASIAASTNFWRVFESPDVDLDGKLDADVVQSLLIPTVGGGLAPGYDSPATLAGISAAGIIAGSPSPLEVYLADGPEVSLVVVGQNDMVGDDTSGFVVASFEPSLREIVSRLLAARSIPILVTAPPQRDREILVEQVNTIIRQVAAENQLPLNDYHAEILARHPSDWDGTLIGSDGVHPTAGAGPSNGTGIFTDANLDSNGYALLNYTTLRSYAEVYSYVLTQPLVAVPTGTAASRFVLMLGLGGAAAGLLLTWSSRRQRPPT